MEKILLYLTQESTWTGIVAILTAFGVVLKPELTHAIVAFGLGLFGLIKVIIDENKKQ